MPVNAFTDGRNRRQVKEWPGKPEQRNARGDFTVGIETNPTLRIYDGMNVPK